MLPKTVEKSPNERLIVLDEVPTSVNSSSPFESRNDVVLQGDISKSVKGGFPFHSKRFMTEIDISAGTQGIIRDNIIENTKKDLNRSPNNPFLLNNLGLAYLGLGELDKANDAFSKAIEIRPDMLIASMNLAVVHSMRNEDEKARAIYEYLLKKNPNDTRVLMSLGSTLLRQKKLAEAKTTFRDLLEIDKSNVDARNMLAIIELINGNARTAIKELRECLRFDGNLGALYNNLGVAYGVIGSYPQAIKALRVSLNTFPNSANAASNLAKVVKHAKGLKKAIEVLEDFVGSNNDLSTKELLIEFYVEDGALTKAIRILNSLLSGSKKPELPNNEVARLMNNIGVIFSLNQDWVKAENFYLASIEKAGFINKTPVTNLIDLYFTLGRLEKAREYIRLLQSKFPGDRLYMFYDGEHHYQVNKISEAVASIIEFISDGNKFIPAYGLLSYIYSEHMYEYKRAIDLLTNAFGHSPNNLGIINNLAYNYLMNNDIRNAQDLLERTGEQVNGVFLTATKGLLEIKLGNIERGRELYNKAAGLAVNEKLHKQVLQKKELEIGRYYLADNKSQEAKRHLEKAKSIGMEDSIFTKQAIELLRGLF